jgi:hypothetical protein
MKSSSPIGVTLAILAAAAVGVVATWMLMRRPPQVVVVFGATPAESGRTSRLDQRTIISPAKENTPAQSVRIPSLIPTPPASAVRPMTTTGERPGELVESASPAHSVPAAAVVYQEVRGPVVQQTNQVLHNEISLRNPQRSTVPRADLDDALSFALEAAEPYVKDGFTVREDFWAGDLPVRSTKAIVHQLFKGNEYWFWVGTSVKEARISVHLYDSEGKI